MNPPTIVSLEDELRGLYNVKKHASEFDRIVEGHMDWGGCTEIKRSYEPAVIDGMIAVGEAVLRGELPIGLEDTSHGRRNFADLNGIRLHFFAEYLHDADLPEEYRYQEPKR